MGCSQSSDVVNRQGLLLQRGLLRRYLHFLWTGPEDSPELVPLVQMLMDETMLLSPSPKEKRLPTRLIARKVLRNTNMGIYSKYALSRHHLRDLRRGKIERVEVATRDGAQRLQAFRSSRFGGRETSRKLEEPLNEVYLWHGTSYEALGHIFSEDFRVGAQKRAFPAGFFGQGLYFAESCAKADEYCTEAKHHREWYTGHEHVLQPGAPVCAMVLCRVVLGRVCVLDHAGDHSRAVGVPACGRFDSLIGCRKAHRREFIVYSDATVFPEFAVLYERHYQQDGGVAVCLPVPQLNFTEDPPTSPKGSKLERKGPFGLSSRLALKGILGRAQSRRVEPAIGLLPGASKRSR